MTKPNQLFLLLEKSRNKTKHKTPPPTKLKHKTPTPTNRAQIQNKEKIRVITTTLSRTYKIIYTKKTNDHINM